MCEVDRTYYNYFRDYDPTTGRYVESDPLGIKSGLDTYLYVKGNPLLRSDARGLRSRICCRPIVPKGGVIGFVLSGFSHCFVETSFDGVWGVHGDAEPPPDGTPYGSGEGRKRRGARFDEPNAS